MKLLPWWKVFALSVLMVSCSKKEDPKVQASVPEIPKSIAGRPYPDEKAIAAFPKPPAKPVGPIVSPAHLPPNPRLPQGSLIADANARHRRMPQVQSQTVTSGEAPDPALPTAPAADVQTPELRNQARLRALQEKFRARDQKAQSPQPSAQGQPIPTSTPTPL